MTTLTCGLIEFLTHYSLHITVAVVAYLGWMLRCWRMYISAKSQSTLAPIVCKGEIAESLGAEAAVVLTYHLDTVVETFSRIGRGSSVRHISESNGRELQDIVSLIETYSHLELARELREPGDFQVPEELVLSVGTFTVPVGAIVGFLRLLFHWVPVPFRNAYERELIRLSLVSSGEQTQLIVYKQANLGTPPATTSISDAGSYRGVLTKTAKTPDLAAMSDLLKDAAFMVLQIQRSSQSGREWYRRRMFVDGLDELDRYIRTGKRDAMKRAMDYFRNAVEEGPNRNNCEVLYIHGSLLMLERNLDSVRLAIELFKRALVVAREKCIELQQDPTTLGLPELSEEESKMLHKASQKAKTEEEAGQLKRKVTTLAKLVALIDSGLAFCHVQQIHRLAKTSDKSIKEDAMRYAERASSVWANNVAEPVHSLILSRSFLAQIMEKEPETTAARRELALRYVEASNNVTGAVTQERDNWTYYNMLGWVLLNLSEWNFLDVRLTLPENVPDENCAISAEWCFKRALDLNPDSKLVAANLGLLYSAPFFRKKAAAVSADSGDGPVPINYRLWSRYYGLKAVKLDPAYKNGYRDLAIGLIRYGDHEIKGEAYGYFIKALELADRPEKDHEIIEDIDRTLREGGASTHVRSIWRQPDRSVFEPIKKP